MPVADISPREAFAKARDAGLVSESLLDRGAEHDAGVFDGVVHIDVGIALSLRRPRTPCRAG